MTDATTLTREQLEERLAALHKTSLELIQDISIESLLNKIAEIARQQVNATYAAVGIMNQDGELEQFIPVGMAPKEIARMAHPPLGLGLIGHLMNSRETIRIEDIADHSKRSGFPEHHPEMTSFLGVPIIKGDVQYGQIYLTNKQGAPAFSADDQMVIETLAAYAAVAIANARLYNGLNLRDHALSRRNENLALLNELASTLASSTDTDQIIDKALSQVMDYLHLEAGQIYLRQEDSPMLKLVLHRSSSIQDIWQKTTFRFGEGVIGKVAQTGQPQLINLSNCDRCGLSPSVYDDNVYQLVCFPLTGRRGVLGVLVVATLHPQPLDELELQFLSSISLWVGTALENVTLNLQQRRLAILEERERIGMDLHDGIIQSIYAVGLTLEHARLLMAESPEKSAPRIEQAIADLNSTIRDIRAYILDLRPRQLYEENLLQGVHRLVAEFRANTLIDVNLNGKADDFNDLPDSQALALFHICQETLANIAKHARATRVDVNLWTAAERALLEVSDDGRGFDMKNTRLTIGHGLANMQTRAQNVGGEVDITSEPGDGTTILAWVPFLRDNETFLESEL